MPASCIAAGTTTTANDGSCRTRQPSGPAGQVIASRPTSLPQYGRHQAHPDTRPFLGSGYLGEQHSTWVSVHTLIAGPIVRVGAGLRRTPALPSRCRGPPSEVERCSSVGERHPRFPALSSGGSVCRCHRHGRTRRLRATTQRAGADRSAEIEPYAWPMSVSRSQSTLSLSTNCTRRRDIAALNDYQEHGRFHPFTCGHGAAGEHAGGVSLVATADGWRCPFGDCDYTQDWAWTFMAASENAS